MDVKVIKLVSGEEILSEVVFEDEKEFVVKNPVAVILQRGQNQGEIGVGFMPFAAYLPRGSSITISRMAVVFDADVDDELRNQYSAIFGGIVTPPKQIILG